VDYIFGRKIMSVNNLLRLSLILSIAVFSCKVSEKNYIEKNQDALSEIAVDTTSTEETVETEIKLYRAERTRLFKLIHTKLQVSFDWEKQYLNGIATLTLEPYFYDQSTLQLDAKGLEIHDVALEEGEKTNPLKFNYSGKELEIALDKSYQKGQKIHIQVNYTAKPNEGDFADNPGSDQKGLYFINPKGEIKGKPQQIWTLGETESNSRWFPTLDAPNQKSTEEMFITVANKYKTLSNGNLIYSKSNPDSTRTDYWKMDIPHAPYLFMIAVGDFAVYEDEWDGMKVDYYTEQAYGKYAKNIFGHTPEMIGYFSKILNYPFPWPKYSQVIVRDFVSGAMENTTASVFMEELNMDSRELLDYDWDDIIAHELFHQWFGDLVTCESWSNLPLNESFATYAEYLWINHKYGKDEGDYHIYEDLDTYLTEAESKQVDLIRFNYEDSEEMFDGHSYAKGGLILHLLRNYVGDEAFFASLEFYLKSHAFGKAEIHELRLAFEHITGEDLNWFFNQWFLSAGHPKLRIEEGFEPENNKYIVKVWQDQDIELYPVFKLPMILDLWQKGNKETYTIEIDRPYQEFEFENVSNPDLVLMDSEFSLVGEIKHIKTAEQYQFQFTHYNDNVRARLDAISFFTKNPTNSYSHNVFSKALEDSFWVIRQKALEVIEQDTADLFTQNEELIVKIANNDPNPLAKAEAISVLETKAVGKYTQVFKSNLNDSSYSVAGQALYAYLQSDDADLSDVISNFAKETNFNITSSLADYFIKKNEHNQYAWYLDKLHLYSGQELYYFIKIFTIYLVNSPDDQIDAGIKALEELALNHYQFYNRFAAYQGLEMFSDVDGVPEILKLIQEKETDPRVRAYFE